MGATRLRNGSGFSGAKEVQEYWPRVLLLSRGLPTRNVSRGSKFFSCMLVAIFQKMLPKKMVSKPSLSFSTAQGQGLHMYTHGVTHMWYWVVQKAGFRVCFMVKCLQSWWEIDWQQKIFRNCRGRLFRRAGSPVAAPAQYLSLLVLSCRFWTLSPNFRNFWRPLVLSGSFSIP